MEAATKEGKKKKAPIVFSKDMKGNIVWTLRSATAEDTNAIFPLVEKVLTRDLVDNFVSTSPCCVVCEASVKGTKEGEGFAPKIMGVVLVDVNNHFNDESNPNAKHGYLVTVFVDNDMPDEDAPKKMVLGSLKKMKDYGVVKVIHSNDHQDRIDLITQCLFKQNGKDEFGYPFFECNLRVENPDPQKKLL